MQQRDASEDARAQHTNAPRVCTCIRTHVPPIHTGNTCWNSLTEPKCPMCNKFDLEALSPTEFLSALSTGRHAA